MTQDPQQDSDIRALLRGLRVEPEDDGFSLELHRKLVAAGPPPAIGFLERLRALILAHPLRAGAAAGAAAGVAAFVLLLVLRGAGAPANPAPTDGTIAAAPEADTVFDLGIHQVPVQKVAVIQLSVSAEVSVESVDFTVNLPDGLVFWNEGEVLASRSFHWTAALQEGDNSIPIAVRGDRPGRYEVIAIVEMGDERFEHVVSLEVTEA